MSVGASRPRVPRGEPSGTRLLHALRRVGRSLLGPRTTGAPTRHSRVATTLIGLDVARPPIRLKTHSWAPLFAAGIVGAMFLAVLRVDVTRIRLGLAESVEEELRLEALKRELTVEIRRLRDPAALSRRARELGFERAEQLIDLPDHAAGHLPASRGAPTSESVPHNGPVARPAAIEIVALDGAPRGGMRP